MKQRHVGSSGLRVSSIGLGTKSWGQATSFEQAEGIVRRYVDSGGNLIDSSPSYAGGAAQQMLGKFLGSGTLIDARFRDSLVISTAAGVFPDRPLGQRVDCSRRALLSQLDATLTELGTDYVDIWSVEFFDPKTPVSEVAETLEFAVRSGKCRYAGVRGYRGWQLALAHCATPAIVVTQAEYNLLSRTAEVELLPAASHLGVGLFAGASLAQGILSGKFRDAGPTQLNAEAEVQGRYDARSATIVEALHTAAHGLGIDPVAAALAWTLSRDGVSSALVGVRNEPQLAAVLDANWVSLPHAIVEALDEISA